MADIEMFDYLSTVVPDYGNETTEPHLLLVPHNSMTEASEKNQIIHTADDNSEERISLSDDNIFTVTLQWNIISEADAGTIVDYYFSATKGNGITRTFIWDHPTDGHSYTVRFSNSIQRQINPAAIYDIKQIKLRVIGNYVI